MDVQHGAYHVAGVDICVAWQQHTHQGWLAMLIQALPALPYGRLVGKRVFNSFTHKNFMLLDIRS